MVDLIKDWYYDPNSFKIIGDNIYPVPRLKKSPMLIYHHALSSIYGKKDSLNLS
jgi:hypothetical protein